MLLADQDRAAWDREEIAEGVALLDRAVALGGRGRYTVQALIAAGHARPGGTRLARGRRRVRRCWSRSTTARSWRSTARSRSRWRSGPEAGLALADEQADALDGYHLLHATRADLLRRLGRRDEAAAAYRRALELAGNPVERAFLERRLADVEQ